MFKLLQNLNRLARRLYPLRLVFPLLAVCGILSGVYAAISAQDTYTWQLRLSLIFSLWALMVFACIQLFGAIPSPVLPNLGFFERLRDRLKLLLHQALVLFVIVLTALLLQMSLKLLFIRA